MRLKQIKLAGFKSFVDPTTVIFPGNRCAVVGPNGCGKSNIIDAVRWVMGESSAKNLRGESITDVIFNGSNSRKPTSQASIELLFDNSDGRVGGEYAAYAELAIRRQVNREAVSTYFLNGSKCRRRDILDVFLGTGFGPRSYSIIEQGMISQLVEAKPEELRGHLEEAAGISKYKERRRETENRIKHTRENLERINDIREELGKQLERLQRQANAAEKYQTLKAEETTLTAQLYSIRHKELSEKLGEMQTLVAEQEVGLERAQAEQRTIDTQIEAARQSYTERSDEFNKVQGQYYALGADIARAEEAIQFNTERVRQLEIDLQTAQARNAESARQIKLDDEQIVELTAAQEAIAPALEEAAAADAENTQRLRDLEQEHQSLQARWESFNTEAGETDRNAQVQASRIEHLGQLLQRLRGRYAQLESDADTMPILPLGQMDSLASEMQQKEHESRTAESDIDTSMKALAAAREEVLRREQAREEARNVVQNLRHELASLQAVQQAALGRGDDSAAQAWMEDQHLDSAGRVGEGLAVVPGWEQAVEVVLGPYLQGLRVNDAAHYSDALQSLSSGSVTLVENGADETSGFVANVATPGSLPTLASLVRESGIRITQLLHDVFAAESAAVALGVRSELQAGQSIVTRSGLWIGATWIRRIAGEQDATGIIERGKQIDVLAVELDESESQLAELERHVIEARDAVEGEEQRRETLQSLVTRVTAELGELKAAHGVRRVQQEEAEARAARVALEKADLDGQIETETLELEQAREALGAAEQQRELLSAQREVLSSQREQAEQSVSGLREQARTSRDEYHQLNVEQQNLTSRLSASQTARKRLQDQQESLAEQLENIEKGIAASQMPLPELQNDLEQKLSSRLEVEQQLTSVRTSMEEAEASIRKLDGERSGAERRVNDVRTALEGARLERQSLVVNEENIKEQIASTGLDADVVRAELPQEATALDWEEQLAKMDRRITRLGPINLAAIEEYTTQSERKVYLDQQNEDLEEALDTLLTAIRKIDRETRSRFKDTFETVNTRLGELFPKVFGGGHAYLELTGEDLLDTGVTLMAQPPGKRNASIHLLSGGEKAMTAVALVFAIFHLNPSPVCMLDEVDAPLDDSNVMRFADLIREMSADVQFVVITHNKLTMEMADHLMGVTMQEPGVSRLVSVDVEEAAAMAAM